MAEGGVQVPLPPPPSPPPSRGLAQATLQGSRSFCPVHDGNSRGCPKCSFLNLQCILLSGGGFAAGSPS